MNYSKSTRITIRQISRMFGGGLLAVVAVLSYRLLASSPLAATLPIGIPRSEQLQAQRLPPQEVENTALLTDAAHSELARPQRPVGEVGIPRGQAQPGAPSEADGVVPNGVTIFDDDIPGVARLDPALLAALRQAATDAAGDGVEFYVNSGWRSPEYQSQLLREAIFEYGSEAEAARWVATADTSPHVSGDAIDIGPSDAAAWLSEQGVGYGLCQIYRNEPWHYELRPEAIEHGCPPMYADPTHDPRMRR